MRTIASELAEHLDWSSSAPRVYADANVPARMVEFMRLRLGWDVLFVLEHVELRRAKDQVHFRMACRMRRTLLSLDHDYFDDARFPMAESGGVIVVSAADDRSFAKILGRLDRGLMRQDDPVPLAGRKLLVDVGWRP